MNGKPETNEKERTGTAKLPPNAPAAANGAEKAANSPPESAPLTAEVRRLLLAIVLVSGFAELAYVIVNISAMPVYILAIGLDSRWISAVMAAYLVVEGVLKSPFGVLGDRIGRKTLMLVGPIVSTFTALLTPSVHNPYALVGLRVLDGMGAAALWPAAFSLIGDHVPEERRSSAMSLFNVAYLIGLALGPALGGGINDYARHHLHLPFPVAKEASFYVAALLFAVTAAVAALSIPSIKEISHDPKKLGPGIEGGFDLAGFVAMLRSMPAMLLMAFVTFLGVGLVTAYAKIFAMEMFHLNESQFGILLIIPALIIAAFSLPLGTLGDKIGRPKAVRLGIGLCAGAFWMMILLASEWALVLFGSVLGLGFVIAFPAWMAEVSAECEDSQRGAAVGAVGTAQGVGAIVGVAVSGVLYKLPPIHLGLLTIPKHGLPFLGCAVMLTLSFLLSLVSLHSPHRPTS